MEMSAGDAILIRAILPCPERFSLREVSFADADEEGISAISKVEARRGGMFV
jgi:hypothetical protein